jgi:hypothetical protein
MWPSRCGRREAIAVKTLEPLATYILQRAARAERTAELHPNILSANFEVGAAEVQQLLVRLDSGGLVEVSKWDDEGHAERRLRDFPSPSEFFASVCDAGFVRVRLQGKGKQALEARNAAQSPPDAFIRSVSA